MEIRTQTTYQMDKYDKLSLTTYETCGGGLGLHCSDFCLRMSAEQAKAVGHQLIEGGLKLDAHALSMEKMKPAESEKF